MTALRRTLRRLVLALVAATAAARGVLAHAGEDETERLRFDRPEAWAMQYFASASILTGLGPPSTRDPWSLDLALEMGWLPHLDQEQRRVGFNGTKVEDLNRLPVLVRPRLTVGLPARFSLDLSWVPPVEAEGVKSNLVAAALERPLVERGRWVLGLRALGQVGEIKGDLTCSEEDASHPPGSPENEFGCQEPSRDVVGLDYAGLAVTGGVDLSASGRSSFYYAAGASYLDLEFQVDAMTYDMHDHTLLLAEGWTYWASAGVSWRAGERTTIAAETFYSPLEVRRGAGAPVEHDDFFNLRLMLGYRLR